jgi:hypothetical protein
VERRTGGLHRAVESDHVSDAYKLAEAEVVGNIISRARAGHPVLERLLAQNPGLQEPARLYFTQDLFGSGAAPTPSGLRTWLVKNERPLKQLGLFDEFKDIKTAREAAARSVAEAKGRVGEAAAAAEAAGADEKQAGKAALREGKLFRAAGKNVESATKGLKTPEAMTAESGKAADKASREVASGLATSRSKLAGHISKRQQFESFQTELANAPPKQVAGKIRTFANQARDNGLISGDIHDELLKQANEADKHFNDTARMRKVAAYVAAAIGTGYVGQATVRKVLGE